MNFHTKQLQTEIKYIENKYLSSIIEYNKGVMVEDDFSVKKIILNGIPYKIYTKKTEEFEILLIPDTNKLFDKNFNFAIDFDNIIRYKKSNEGINLSVISKKDNYINTFNYSFYTNESGYSTGNYYCDSFIDNNYILQFEFLKNNTSIPRFLYNLNIRKLTDSGYRLDRIKRNKNETKLNQINETSILKAYQLYDSRFTKLNDNNSPILSIFENMYEKNNIKTRI